MEKLIIDEDMALLEHHLISIQYQSTSSLIYRMIDDIDMMLKALNNTAEITPTACYSSNDKERLQTLKKDAIDQAILTSSNMRANRNIIIETKQNKFSLENRCMESTSDWQRLVSNAIENRRLHMTRRTDFMIKQKLRTSLNP